MREWVATLARRAAEAHAAAEPDGPITRAWLATAFLADVAPCEGVEELWAYYVEVATEHRARAQAPIPKLPMES